MAQPFSEFVTIGDIAEVKGGKRLPRGMVVQDEKTPHPYLRVVDFNDDGLDLSNIKYISESAFAKVKRYTISSDDVYISIAGTIGRIGIVPKRLSGANLTENAAKITSISCDIDRIFLMYYLRSHLGQSDIAAKVVGTSQPKLALFRIKELKVPKVPLPTQRTIAAILSAYDHLIENNLRRIAILEEMAQALYREWFVEFRFPDHEQVRMVDSALGRIPEGWAVKKLRDVAVVNRAQVNKRTAPNEVRYIDISSVSPGRIDTATTYAFAEAPGRARRIVQHGDVLWSCVRPNRRSYALVIRPVPNTVASTGFAVLTATQVPFTFLYSATTTDDFVGYLSNNATGAAYPAVTGQVFENADLLVPPTPELEKFNNATAPMVERIHLLQLQIDNLRSARDLLLPRLISGELDVADLDISIPEAAA